MKEKKKTKAKKGTLLKKTADAIILVLFISVTLVICAFLIRNIIFSRFLPGTYAGNLDISMQTSFAAKNSLEEAASGYSEGSIKVKLNNVEKTFTTKELGINILTGETISAASDENYKNASIVKYLSEPTEKKIFPLKVAVDKKALTSALNTAFKMDSLKAVEASFYIDNQAKLQINASKDGQEIDQTKLVQDIIASAEKFDPMAVITLQLKPTIPTITTAYLEAQKPSMLESLRHRITLTHPLYKDKWSLSMVQHLDWVNFVTEQAVSTEQVGGLTVPKIKNTIVVKIDGAKFNKYIDDTIAKYLDAPVENVKIYKNPEGKIIIEGRGDNGLKIQRSIFQSSVELAIIDKVDKVTIPTVEEKPTVTVSQDLQDLGIKEVVSIGHTTFFGSPLNRIYNIGVATPKFNGILLAPDEEFNFNKILGPVDGVHGYLMELVIKPEGTIPEFGGGVCQVSTTMYRAALFAGLPITERHQHSYAVAYYSQILGPGLDATIYIGGPNLKFKNDTGKHLLIQAYVKNKHELYFVIYGTSDGRKTELDGPYISNRNSSGEVVYEEVSSLPLGKQKQVEIGHIGFDTLWHRYITFPDGRKITEDITSAFRIVPKKIQVGTGGAPATTTPGASTTGTPSGATNSPTTSTPKKP
jgi:vancomycin resistance protein YoaR